MARRAAGLTLAVRRRRHTMPHMHDIVGQLFEPSPPNGPLLIDVLLDAGAVHGEGGGRRLRARRGRRLRDRASCSPSRGCSQRGFLPVHRRLADHPDPRDRADGRRLASAARALAGWVPVAVIAAYLTFFPVTINTLRGLQSADPRALELMRSYAASRGRPLEAARAGLAARTSSRRSRSRRPRASSARSSASCPRRSRTGSAARSSTSTSTTRSTARASGRRTSSRPRSGSSSSCRRRSPRSSSSAARRSTSHERAAAASSRSRSVSKRFASAATSALAGHRPRRSSPASSSR